MKANYTIEAGDVRVIRPLIYVREQATRDFSQTSQLPIINENCPACFEQPKVSSALIVDCRQTVWIYNSIDSIVLDIKCMYYICMVVYSMYP